MTHLRIELNTIPENVTSNVIHKLYETAKAIIDAEEANEVEESQVSLKGNLLTTIAYDDEVQWLIDKFGPELSINVTLGRAIKFEDPNMLAYLNNLGIGSNGYITKPDAAAATVVANSGNSTVTKFNELKYFTNITGSSGGFNGDTAGVIKFKGWSALLEIDISNFTSIGHNTGYRYEDTFMECSALTTVKASNKLSAIGHCAFRLCGNLETITGLSGTITLSAGYLFYRCSKLQDSSFLNVLIKFGSDIGTDNFMSCGLLTAIALDPTTTIIPDRCFRDCSALTTVTGTNNIETIGIGAFLNTAISSINIPNAVTIGNEAFKSCAQLQSISIPNATSIGTQAFLRSGITSADISSVTSIPGHCFNTCEHLTTVTGTPLSINEGAFLNCYVLNTIDLSNVTTIGLQSFLSCRALSAINLSSITEIGSLAFLGCSGLTSVITGSSSFTIGPTAFASCGELTTMNLSHCTSIGSYAFIHDRKLVTSDLSSCTSVGESAFLNCSSLTSLDLSSCTSIGNNAFTGCTSLQSITLGGTSVVPYGTSSIPSTILHIYVPSSLVESYKTSAGWSAFASVISATAE